MTSNSADSCINIYVYIGTVAFLFNVNWRDAAGPTRHMSTVNRVLGSLFAPLAEQLVLVGGLGLAALECESKVKMGRPSLMGDSHKSN